MSRANDLAFVHDTLNRLQDSGIIAWVFGGWADELLGLQPQRTHRDLDLLYLATDFGQLDAFLASDSQVTEIAGKRFQHKRAFLYHHVMVEVILVQPAQSGEFFTLFWGDTQYEWPADVFGTEINGIRVASATSLCDYRTNYAWLRWSPDRATRSLAGYTPNDDRRTVMTTSDAIHSRRTEEMARQADPDSRPSGYPPQRSP